MYFISTLRCYNTVTSLYGDITMRRHAKVKNAVTRREWFVPYSDDCDTPRYKMSIEDQVASWCKDHDIPGPLFLIETGSLRYVNVRLY